MADAASSGTAIWMAAAQRGTSSERRRTAMPATGSARSIGVASGATRCSAQAARTAAIALLAVRRLKMRIADPLRVEALDRLRRQCRPVDQPRVALQPHVAH